VNFAFIGLHVGGVVATGRPELKQARGPPGGFSRAPSRFAATRGSELDGAWYRGSRFPEMGILGLGRPMWAAWEYGAFENGLDSDLDSTTLATLALRHLKSSLWDPLMPGQWNRSFVRQASAPPCFPTRVLNRCRPCPSAKFKHAAVRETGAAGRAAA